MPERVRVGQVLCISEERSQCPKAGLMVAMAVEVGTSSCKAMPSYPPYYIFVTGSM